MIDLSAKKRIGGAENWAAGIDMQYHPTGALGEESQDLVYNYGDITRRRDFIPVLLKEWVCLAKKGGYVVVDYRPNKFCYWQELERYLWWLWKDRVEIVFHGAVSSAAAEKQTQASLTKFVRYHEEYPYRNRDPKSLLPPVLPTAIEPQESGGCVRLVLKKLVSTVIKGDSMGKWTFGVITNGKRLDFLEAIIASIRRQKIPRYEIIICGSYYDRGEKDCVYIPYNTRDDIAWISRKKNIIAKNAKYENIFIFHDRMVLEDGWYADMKKWGNCFEFLFPLSESYHIGSFFMVGRWTFPFFLRKDEWNLYNYSAFIVSKKSIFTKVLFRETAYWSGNKNTLTEDIACAYDAVNMGHIYRNTGSCMVRTLVGMKKPDSETGIVKKTMYAVFRGLGFFFTRLSLRKILFPFRHVWLAFSKSSAVTKKVK